MEPGYVYEFIHLGEKTKGPDSKSIEALTPEQRHQALPVKPLEELFPGTTKGYNPPGYAEPEPKDMQAERDQWDIRNPAGLDRGKNAVIGAVGLYSVLEDVGYGSDGIESALGAFFEDAKHIAQASAMGSIYGDQAPENGKSLNEQSLDAVKALRDAIYDAGLENSADPEHEPRDAVTLFDQEISACEQAGDARDFMTEIARVVQDRNWTQDIEADLEKMGTEARVRALLYREPDTVPERYASDYKTQEALQGFADGLG